MNRLEPFRHRDGPLFQDAWQAQILGIADTLILSGVIDGQTWNAVFEKQLAEHQAQTEAVSAYYLAALDALEIGLRNAALVNDAEREKIKELWINAYLSTPHGHPVELAVRGIPEQNAPTRE